MYSYVCVTHEVSGIPQLHLRIVEIEQLFDDL